MYLTQLILNPANRNVLLDVTRPYEMHRTLGCAFQSDRVQAEMLYRVEANREDRQIGLLVQSGAPGDWARLPEGYVLSIKGPIELDYKQILRAEQRWRFRLCASPTKRVGNSSEDKKMIGKRIGILGEEKQLEWLKRKGDQHGFEPDLESIVVCNNDHQRSVKTDSKTGKEYAMSWLSVRFDGILRVTDAQAFAQAVECGIGSAKGMGFGLLSLAPAS